MYYDIYKFFNTILIEYFYNKLSYETVEISNQLINSLSGIYYNIKWDNKYYVDIFPNNTKIADKIVYTGKIDEYFGYKFGKLENRTIRWDNEVKNIANFQGAYIINELHELN